MLYKWRPKSLLGGPKLHIPPPPPPMDTPESMNGAVPPFDGPIRPSLTMRPLFNRMRSSQQAVPQIITTPAAETPPIFEAPEFSSPEPELSPSVFLPLPPPDSQTIERFHDYLRQHYSEQELTARLSNRRPCNRDDMHVLALAAAHANIWVNLDREFQAVIHTYGMDFCTLTSTVHAVLNKLEPYDYINSDSEADSTTDDDAEPVVERHSIDDVVDPVPVFAEDKGGSVMGRMLTALDRKRSTVAPLGVKTSRPKLMQRLSSRGKVQQAVYRAPATSRSSPLSSGRVSAAPRSRDELSSPDSERSPRPTKRPSLPPTLPPRPTLVDRPSSTRPALVARPSSNTLPTVSTPPVVSMPPVLPPRRPIRSTSAAAVPTLRTPESIPLATTPPPITRGRPGGRPGGLARSATTNVVPTLATPSADLNVRLSPSPTPSPSIRARLMRSTSVKAVPTISENKVPEPPEQQEASRPPPTMPARLVRSRSQKTVPTIRTSHAAAPPTQRSNSGSVLTVPGQSALTPPPIIGRIGRAHSSGEQPHRPPQPSPLAESSSPLDQPRGLLVPPPIPPRNPRRSSSPGPVRA